MGDNQRSSAFRKLEPDTTDSTPDFTNLGFINQMVRVMTAQNSLINKLLERQNMLCQVLSKRQQSSNSSSGSDNKLGNSTKVCEYRDVNQGQNNSSKSPDLDNPFTIKNNVKIIQNQKSVYSQHKVHLKNDLGDESNSSLFEVQSQSDNREVKPSFKKKQTETKNMVKNFAKAIFSYIKKNKDKTSRVLKYLGISDQEFMKVFEQLRGHVHSISQLRNLWTPEGNIYHKAFRILSCDYLRKKCLGRTFNSRVQNFMVHLKYRQRLLQGIKSPDQFTIMKTS